MRQLNRPVEINGQRTSGLRTTDLRVLALWHILVWFHLRPRGFANRALREQLAVLNCRRFQVSRPLVLAPVEIR